MGGAERHSAGPAASVETGLARVLTWAAARDYAGHSKFDLFNAPRLEEWWPRHHRAAAVLTALWARSPVDLRRRLRVPASRNPKGIALFGLVYLRRYQALGDQADLGKARALLDWLDANAAPGYSGKCWGYDHPWVSVHFAVPRHGPNIVVTGNVAYAFLEAYEVTGEARYLAVARSIVDFLLRDLTAPVDTPEMRSIGYVPGSRWGVLNINGLAASILARTARHTGEAELSEHARRLIAFLVDKQTPYGAWNYAWPAQTSRVKHDNYHTGNVLDWVLDYATLTGDQSFREAYRKGLVFYRDHLFLANGFPKWRSDRIYPADAHSAAQGIVTFAKAAREFDPVYLDQARRVAGWCMANLQHPEGWFIYQQGRFWTKRYTLMRWCNAWMAYAFASLLIAERATSVPPAET